MYNLPAPRLRKRYHHYLNMKIGNDDAKIYAMKNNTLVS